MRTNNHSLTCNPSVRRSPDGGVMMELRPSLASFQHQFSSGSASSLGPGSSANFEKLCRSQSLQPKDDVENILFRGDPVVGYRLASKATADLFGSNIRQTNPGSHLGAESSHCRSMSSLAVPANAFVHAKHSRGGSGRSLDALDSSKISYYSTANFNANGSRRQARICEDSIKHVRSESTLVVEETASRNTSPKLKPSRKTGHFLLSKLAGTSFSASFH